MKKLSIIAVLAFGMMLTACKKDETTIPVSTGGTVTIDFNANISVDVIKDDKSIYFKQNTNILNPIDSSIVIKNVADNSRFDIALVFHKKYSGSLKIKYNDKVVLDTLVLDTTKTLYGISVSYFANKQLWVTP